MVTHGPDLRLDRLPRGVGARWPCPGVPLATLTHLPVAPLFGAPQVSPCLPVSFLSLSSHPHFSIGLSSWDPGLVQSSCMAPGQVWQAVDGCSAPYRHSWLDKCMGGWMDRQVDESAGLGRPQDGGEPVPRRPPPSTCLPTQFLLLCRPWSLCSVQHRYHCCGAGQEEEGHTHWTPV